MGAPQPFQFPEFDQYKRIAGHEDQPGECTALALFDWQTLSDGVDVLR